MTPANFYRFAAICLLALAAGCSRFDRQWTDAMAKPVSSGSIEGPWQGSWTSDGGHSGRLRCILQETAPDQYRAHFDARFMGIFRFDHATTLTAQHKDGGVDVVGDKNLGYWRGGVYHYEGHITPEKFAATYKSKYDQGTFAMTRPKATN
jgi:hypothetical protein